MFEIVGQGVLIEGPQSLTPIKFLAVAVDEPPGDVLPQDELSQDKQLVFRA